MISIRKPLDVPGEFGETAEVREDALHQDVVLVEGFCGSRSVGNEF
jgi:hypothetical protein